MFNINDPTQKAALRTELEQDPSGLGYAQYVAAGNDIALSELLNEVRAAISIRRSDISASEIFHAIAVADLVNNPGASQLEWFNAMLHAAFPIQLLNQDGSATPVRSNVIGLVRAGTPSLSRLGTLETRPGSRAEELFGAGTSISYGDVGTALRG